MPITLKPLKKQIQTCFSSPPASRILAALKKVYFLDFSDFFASICTIFLDNFKSFQKPFQPEQLFVFSKNNVINSSAVTFDVKYANYQSRRFFFIFTGKKIKNKNRMPHRIKKIRVMRNKFFS